MPTEEQTYRVYVREKLSDIVGGIEILDKKVTYTNSKVKKITLALTALGFFSLGLGLNEFAPIIKLFIAL